MRFLPNTRCGNKAQLFTGVLQTLNFSGSQAPPARIAPHVLLEVRKLKKRDPNGQTNKNDICFFRLNHGKLLGAYGTLVS